LPSGENTEFSSSRPVDIKSGAKTSGTDPGGDCPKYLPFNFKIGSLPSWAFKMPAPKSKTIMLIKNFIVQVIKVETILRLLKITPNGFVCECALVIARKTIG